MTRPAARPCAFLDRDGVLNHNHPDGYVCRLEDIRWMAGAGAAVRRLNDLGYLVIVVTNQSGIGAGYYDEAAMHAIHAALRAHLALAGARLDAIYYAPHHQAARDARYRHPDHPLRKPNPGMILQAMADFAIDPARSFLIGDKPTDLQAAHRAGIPGHLFAGGDLDERVRAILARATNSG